MRNSIAGFAPGGLTGADGRASEPKNDAHNQACHRDDCVGRGRGFRGRLAELSQPGAGAAAARPRPHRDPFAAGGDRPRISRRQRDAETSRAFVRPAAVHGLVRARRAGGIDPVDGVSEKTWRDRLADPLCGGLEAKPAYAMFRFISVDDGGREIVRVDRIGTKRHGPDRSRRGTAAARRRAPISAETIKLAADKIYVSPLDLGRRNGLIEETHRPTIADRDAGLRG